MKDTHLGKLIKEKFEEKQQVDKYFSKSTFARQIHVHRTTVYQLFEQRSLDIELLVRISKALDYNFVEEYLKDMYE